MNRLLIFLIPLLFVSCGDDSTKEESEEPRIVLKTDKDRLSYVLGSMNAASIVGTQDANIARLDMEAVAKGFGENLKLENPVECEATLKKLFGPNFQDFNEAYAKEGAECLGKLTGYSFYKDLSKMGGVGQVDFKIAKIGFRDGLLKKVSLVAKNDQELIIQAFIKGLNEKNGKVMMDNAKKIPGAKVFENGIIMQTISEGNGKSPSDKDDVIVEYILTSAMGDTIQSSYDMKKRSGSNEPIALSLDGGVIPGWSYIVPKMRKGGKYRVYIPWELAYGEQAGRESLCFFIELVDFGKGGTLVKPKAPQPQQQMQGF